MALASAQIPARVRHSGPGGFKDFEEEFFQAGEVAGSHPLGDRHEAWSWRRGMARVAALAIFSAAVVMAYKALGTTVRHELLTRTQVERVALRAQLVADRDAWARPAEDVRPATPRQRPHSTTAARNRRR